MSFGTGHAARVTRRMGCTEFSDRIAPQTLALLCVSPHQEVDASAQPFEVRICRHAGKCRGGELARRGFGKRGRGLLRPRDAATPLNHLVQPQHLARQATLAWARQKTSHPRAFRIARLRERMDEISRFNRVVVGRELRMIELKKEINELMLKLGSERRYPLEFER